MLAPSSQNASHPYTNHNFSSLHSFQGRGSQEWDRQVIVLPRQADGRPGTGNSLTREPDHIFRECVSPRLHRHPLTQSPPTHTHTLHLSLSQFPAFYCCPVDKQTEGLCFDFAQYECVCVFERQRNESCTCALCVCVHVTDISGKALLLQPDCCSQMGWPGRTRGGGGGGGVNWGGLR